MTWKMKRGQPWLKVHLPKLVQLKYAGALHGQEVFHSLRPEAWLSVKLPTTHIHPLGIHSFAFASCVLS